METKPISVLLIEDNSDDAVLIQMYLSKAVTGPYEVSHADRLAKGLELLKTGGHAVVLLDLGLPDGQGSQHF